MIVHIYKDALPDSRRMSLCGRKNCTNIVTVQQAQRVVGWRVPCTIDDLCKTCTRMQGSDKGATND